MSWASLDHSEAVTSALEWYISFSFGTVFSSVTYCQECTSITMSNLFSISLQEEAYSHVLLEAMGRSLDCCCLREKFQLSRTTWLVPRGEENCISDMVWTLRPSRIWGPTFPELTIKQYLIIEIDIHFYKF